VEIIMENLKKLQKELRKIVNSLTMPAKAKNNLFEKKKWLENAKAVLKRFDILLIKEEIDTLYGHVDRDISQQLKARREDFMNISRQNQYKAERIDSYDKFDILKVEYKGNIVIVSLNNVKLRQKELATGEEIFEMCKTELKKLQSSEFDRKNFFSQLKLSISFLKLAKPKTISPNGSVILKEVYPLMRLVREYQSQKKMIYELPQFIYDIARFVDGGVTEKNYRMEMETPAKAFTREALIIPNLANPISVGKPVRKIRLVPLKESRL
jgi:hypothetical protein